MEIVYHIFKADVYFITLNLIENIIKTSKSQHFFIIVGIDNSNQGFYDNLFGRYKDAHYKYFQNVSSSRMSRFVTFSIKKFFRTFVNNFDIDLIRYLYSLHKPNILLHGDFSTLLYIFLRLNNAISVSWVCWGYIYQVDKKMHIVRKMIYRKIYNNYLKIICLLQEDCNELNRLYNTNNTIYQPYYNDLPLYIDKYRNAKKNRSKETRILLGNSGRCIDAYYKDLERLKKYLNNGISIDCMLNYGSTDVQNASLIKIANSIFGAKFKAHTTLWSKDYYYQFMNLFDVYISSIENQSGLGAIYLLLMLGKKLYVAGKNYTHLKGLGTIIFHSNDISMFSFNEFSRPLKNSEKNKNYSIIQELLNYDSLAANWEIIYSKIRSVKP